MSRLDQLMERFEELRFDDQPDALEEVTLQIAFEVRRLRAIHPARLANTEGTR